MRWITFHSGYDFGYLLKVLTCQPLPQAEPDFFELLKVLPLCLRAQRTLCQQLLLLPFLSRISNAVTLCASAGMLLYATTSFTLVVHSL